MNGLQSLMQGAPRPAGQPQQAGPRPAPAQNDPRMAAAMNVVESNIPEYLNPTDALMKRNQAAELAQQAMALMASADRQTAMSQQPPTPPTIAEQVNQRAMEGIGGIAQRLAPGMQQRGQQVQQAQARKMIGGGMPTMGAPNMQRMANGGIVGYAKGDLVENNANIGRAYIDPNTGESLSLGERVNKIFTDNPLKRLLASASKPARMRELANKFPNASAAELEAMYEQSGLGGGYTYPSDRPKVPQFDPQGNPQIGSGPFPTREAEAEAEAVRTPRDEVVREGIFSPISDASVGTAEGDGGSPQITPTQELLNTLAQQTNEANIANTGNAASSPINDLLMARLNAAPDNAGALSQATSLRETETGLGNAAYAMSPEMKAAYAADRAKRDEYYTSQLDPKRQRSQKLNALLAGLATPGGIARSGIAALEGTTAVDDARIAARRKQAEEDFASTKEQAGIEREGRIKAYEGGRSTFNTAFDRLSGQATQALQTLGAMANSEQTRAQTERLANDKNQLDLTKARLDSIFQQGRLDEQSRATAVRLLDSQSRRLIDFRKQLADILDTLGTPEEKAALMKENEGYIQSQVEVVNAARAQLGMPAMPLTPTSTGGGGDDGFGEMRVQ